MQQMVTKNLKQIYIDVECTIDSMLETYPLLRNPIIAKRFKFKARRDINFLLRASKFIGIQPIINVQSQS